MAGQYILDSPVSQHSREQGYEHSRKCLPKHVLHGVLLVGLVRASWITILLNTGAKFHLLHIQVPIHALTGLTMGF